MGLEILLPILIPILSTLVTELFKRLGGLVVNNVPPAFVPHLSALVGVGIVEGARAAGIELLPGMDGREAEDIVAAGLGYGGTGLHQAVRTAGLTSIPKAKRVLAWLILPLALSLTACAELKDMASKAETIKQEFCKIGPLIISAMETASLAAEAKGDGALAVKIKDARAILLRYGPTVCPAPRTPTDATPASLPALDPRDSLSTSVICNPRLARDG